jgi:hypothetical protein
MIRSNFVSGLKFYSCLGGVVTMLLAAAPLLGQAAADYTLGVHVTASRIGSDCGEVSKGTSSCRATQVLDAVVEGKKYELRSETILPKGVIALGDYKAKLVSDKQKPTHEFTREYDLMFPDGSTRKFSVIGQME